MEKLCLCVCIGREREAPTFGVGVNEGHFTLIIIASSFRQQYRMHHHLLLHLVDTIIEFDSYFTQPERCCIKSWSHTFTKMHNSHVHA